MPFLVDSVTMEVNRHGLTLHLIIHPIVAVVRDADGTLGGGRRRRRRRAPRIVHPCRGRPHRRSGEARRACRRHRPRAGRRARGGRATGRRCASASARYSRRSTKRAPPLPPDELAEGQAFLCVARRQSLHLSRLSPPRARRHRRRGRAEDRSRLEPRHPARRREQGSRDQLRRAAARGHARTRGGPSFWSSPSRHRARPCIARAISTTSPSSASTPRARSCGEDRFLGLFTSTAYSANPAEIPLLRRKIANVVARAGLHAGQPRRQGADQHPRDLSARRAVPDHRRRSAAHGDRHPASGRPAALPPVRAARSVRALPVVPDLRAARELHDRAAAEVAGRS